MHEENRRGQRENRVECRKGDLVAIYVNFLVCVSSKRFEPLKGQTNDHGIIVKRCGVVNAIEYS